MQRLAQIKLIPVDELHGSVNRVHQALDRTMQFAQEHTNKLELSARDFAFSLSRIYMGNSSWSVNMTHAVPITVTISVNLHLLFTVT